MSSSGKRRAHSDLIQVMFGLARSSGWAEGCGACEGAAGLAAASSRSAFRSGSTGRLCASGPAWVWAWPGDGDGVAGARPAGVGVRGGTATSVVGSPCWAGSGACAAALGVRTTADDCVGLAWGSARARSHTAGSPTASTTNPARMGRSESQTPLGGVGEPLSRLDGGASVLLSTGATNDQSASPL